MVYTVRKKSDGTIHIHIAQDFIFLVIRKVSVCKGMSLFSGIRQKNSGKSKRKAKHQNS